MKVIFFVTCGRGLDTFVKEEICEKIPGAFDLQSLGEGKVLFSVKTLPQILDKPSGNQATRSEETEPKSSKSQEKGPLCLETLLSIYKLKLVERIFLMLHYEMIGTDKFDETKLTSILENGSLNDVSNLALTMRKHQKQQAEDQVFCCQPDCCPGLMNRRADKEDIQQKRTAMMSSTRNQLSSRRRNKHQSKRKFPYDGRDVNGCTNIKIEKSENSNVKSEVPFPKKHCGSESPHEEEEKEHEHVHSKPLHENLPTFRTEGECVDLSSERQNSTKPPTEITLKKVNSFTQIANKGDKTSTVAGCQSFSYGKSASVQECDKDDDNNISSSCVKNSLFSKSISNAMKENTSAEEIRPVQFRVSCRIRGKHKKELTSDFLSKSFTNIIEKLSSNWSISWANPDLDFYINITEMHFIIGISLSQESLSLRPYISHHTLRSTTSHLMAKLCRLSPGDCLLDSMCGGGTILAEAAKCFKVGMVIGCDINKDQLEVSKCNLRSLGIPFSLLLCDATGIPLQSNCVSGIVCDFPFGQKHQLISDNETLLMKVIKECLRVLIKGGRAVFLLSSTQHKLLQDMPFSTEQGVESFHPLSLGRTMAYVDVILKR